MAMAYRHGVALRDMEFVQYHPTALPGTGILITEGCRGEGAILTNKDGYRYLQDYGLGPPDPWPRPKAMELGPRDRLSQAFWHEERKGHTIATPQGDAVHLDLRHLGAQKIHERLPLITEVAKTFVGVDPVTTPIPVRPAVHYTMGGIHCNRWTETSMPGLFAAGECSSVGIHGANRLGSNSLAEIVVFGRVAGERAAAYARTVPEAAVGAAAAAGRRRGGAAAGDVGAARPASAWPRCATRWATAWSRASASSARPTTCRPPATCWPTCASAGAAASGSTTTAAPSTPNGCRRSNSAPCSRWPRRWRTRRCSARNRAAPTCGWTASATATTPTSSCIRWPTMRGDGPPAISHEPVNITTSPPKTRHYGGAGVKAELT